MAYKMETVLIHPEILIAFVIILENIEKYKKNIKNRKENRKFKSKM